MVTFRGGKCQWERELREEKSPLEFVRSFAKLNGCWVAIFRSFAKRAWPLYRTDALSFCYSRLFRFFLKQDKAIALR